MTLPSPAPIEIVFQPAVALDLVVERGLEILTAEHQVAFVAPVSAIAGEPGEAGPEGPAGPQGPQGLPGPIADLTTAPLDGGFF